MKLDRLRWEVRIIVKMTETEAVGEEIIANQKFTKALSVPLSGEVSSHNALPKRSFFRLLAVIKQMNCSILNSGGY